MVEPAGNGGMDLDDPIFEGQFNPATRDSGAIMVGAGGSGFNPTGPASRVPLSFTDFGMRVNVQGWGQNIVTTGGRGNLFRPMSPHDGDVRQWYTNTFGGTSGASAIVAGVCASLQGVHDIVGLPRLTSTEMRNLLVTTGTPQAPNTRHIGPLPNIHAAIATFMRPTPSVPVTSSAPPWPSLGGRLSSDPAVGIDQDGRMEVFVRGTDAGLFDMFQMDTLHDWSPKFANFGHGSVTFVGRPAVVRNTDGTLEVFVRGADSAIWHKWQTHPNSDPITGWAGWESLGGDVSSDPAVGINDNGRLEVFARWSDGSLRHAYQRIFRALWSGWESLGGGLLGAPAVVSNQNQALEVFVRGLDNTI